MPGRADIETYETSRVVVRTDASGPSFLFMSDTWMEGWKSSIDGRTAELLRANHAFRAVRLPAGKHLVEFRYRPNSLLAGLAITLFGLAALALMLCF
jgi:uncharacterized membrane protein YfhO